MSFDDIAGDLADRLKKKAGGSAAPAEEKPTNFPELYALRARMLGVLLQDARLAKGQTLEGCAVWVGVPPQQIHAWEIGDATPSLPQLEVMAYHLGVPISQFWSQDTLTGNNGYVRPPRGEYIELRQRIVGALLRKARADADLTLEALAEQTGLTAAQIDSYELGEAAIPMTELVSLASAVDVSLSYFIDAANRVGQLLSLQENFKHFTEMPEDMQTFVSNPTHASFIELAMWLGKLDVRDLRGIAESVLNLSRLDPQQLSQIAEKMLDITL